MWFGTRQFMQEIATPLVRSEFARVGWEESTQWSNGHRSIDGSVNAHREYRFVWPHMSREKVQQITAFKDGVYGPGPFYWIDALAADMNVLSQSGGTPSLEGYDARPWAGDDRPALVASTDQSQGYPVEKVTYTIEGGMPVRPIVVPIPPGHVAWVGIHGDSNAQDRVKITPFSGGVAGTDVHPTILSVSTPTRVNTMVEGDWLELAPDTSNPGPCTLAARIVQILPEGVTPETGRFVPGQGHTGCKFEGGITEIPIVIDGPDSFVQVSAKLVEVG